MPTFEARVIKSTFFPSDLPTLHYQFAMHIRKYAPRQKNHLATQMTQFLESSIAIRLQIWTPYYNFSLELLAHPSLSIVSIQAHRLPLLFASSLAIAMFAP